jgi:beta-lactamase superfamily II metal-dependent hydrolase
MATKSCFSKNGRNNVAPTPSPSLTVLDVGHGNCTILKEAGRTVVFDAGPKSGLLEYLLQQKITKIDLVLISHADEDHIGGLIALLATNSFDIKVIRLNTDSLKGSDIWNDLAFELDELSRKGKLDYSPALTVADNGKFDSADVKVEILGPSAFLATKGPGGKDADGRKITTNSISAVIRLHYKGHAVALLTGDVDQIGIDELKRMGSPIEAGVLIFPHHGGKGASDMAKFSAELYARVKPKWVLFSIGRGMHGTPIPDVIAEARKIANLKISCTELSEHCSAAAPAQEHTHLSPVFARGRDSRHCCAGSITIPLDPGETAFPIWEAHQQFITSSASTALCRK